ncbi:MULTISPECIES: glycosyltransferase family 2 protein [Lactobacillaceae]|uniref:glycosyltransferase family 2 protein n=1 Tax=Lactobacillaceae TaxID=33958 RepID=UPI001C1FFD23|nr:MULTISPECIES: glycosyltransferase family 2 protein [Lactobacillaceae]MBU7530827.1 glycosyltransferase family 2 protein [Lactiplantibacillus pentosus]MCP8848754.1 glycosyltransferase family 2 protein [Latilactobacillus curvatus]MCP8865430.1 glycosyltransferase family 2 protein [Latilactobacillus curvatus]MCP8874306.1 glycosyltransferase family 2 protein [Latilactobacillus curvatus]MCP8876100.1 glycosyltransferase family 2 protein [Latilactobacillus curvatus]
MIKIGVGIVTYNPNIERLRMNIESIYKQCKNLVIVDNNSNNINELTELIKGYNITLIKNIKNLGIATALNQIMATLQNNRTEWVLTLDQDSVAEKDMLQKYFNFIEIESVGIICPTIRDRNTSFETLASEATLLLDKCITSGALTNVSVWEKVGKYDEQMFIDWVDFDFCIRVRKLGYKIIRVNNAVLIHEIGKITYSKLLGFKIEIQNHSAFRKFYMAQNIIYISRKYHKNFISFMTILRLLKIITLVILYESNKKDKLISIFNGILSGLKLTIEF